MALSRGPCRELLFTLFITGNPSALLSKSKKKAQSSKGKKTSSTNKDAQKIAGCIGEKDASLFLFRALGKVLYCKSE